MSYSMILWAVWNYKRNKDENSYRMSKDEHDALQPRVLKKYIAGILNYV